LPGAEPPAEPDRVDTRPGEPDAVETRPGGPDAVDTVFSALADPTRRRLLAELSNRGPMTATELAAGYPVTRQAVVKHLGALSAAGLLDAHRTGREVRYGVVPARLHDATAWMAEVGRRWDHRLEALHEHVGRMDR
jgi:DNA-binding transcriptional ArsR family regulator